MRVCDIEERIKKVNYKRRVNFSKEDFYSYVDKTIDVLIDKNGFPEDVREMLTDFARLFYESYYNDVGMVSTSVYYLDKAFASALTSVHDILSDYEPLLVSFMLILHTEMVPEMPDELVKLKAEIFCEVESDGNADN